MRTTRSIGEMFGLRIATELNGQPICSDERAEFLLSCIRALLFFLKEFSFDITEIDSASFKARLSDLLNSIENEESVRRLEKSFEADKEYILDFISKEGSYFKDKEAELKTIIELLSAGLSDLIGDTQAFNARVYEGNLRLEQISNLDDIRKMREDLKSEIRQMKEMIREKQTKDAKQVSELSSEVTTLKSKLERAHSASLVDSLTGAYNRLAFDTYIRKLMDRNQFSWKTFSLLMCDLDHFKRVNDTYGHRMGDKVLKLFVDGCKTLVRSDDFIGRYGGEEFVIILPGASLKNSMKRAKDICKYFAQKGHIIHCQDMCQTINFTVSIGVSEVHKSDTPESLIERCDRALYQAKNQGRNRAACDRITYARRLR